MVDQIRDAIRCARIGPGTRLPSSRRLSEQLAISRNTAVRAYDLLLMEGIVESRPASGIYVAEQMPPAMPQHCFQRPVRAMASRSGAMPMPSRPERAQSALHSRRQSPVVRFLSGPPERGAVSAEDLAASAAGQSVSRRRGRSDAVWRTGRACGAPHRDRQSPRGGARHRRRSQPHHHHIGHTGRSHAAGAAFPRARRARAWWRIPAITAPRWRSKPPAPKSPVSRSIRTG